jgi:hypothetical protein
MHVVTIAGQGDGEVTRGPRQTSSGVWLDIAACQAKVQGVPGSEVI